MKYLRSMPQPYTGRHAKTSRGAVGYSKRSVTHHAKLPILFITACLTGLAADNVLTPAEKKAGFQLLFDGTTLKGWRDPAKQTPPGDSWIIEDACLRTTPKPRIREDLITEESYSDFELKFDWRISAKGNTGIKYRIQREVFVDESKAQRGAGGFEGLMEREITKPTSDRTKVAEGSRAQVYTVAYEFQLLDDAGYPNQRTIDVHSTGALYSMIKPRTLAARPPGEWNESRIVVKGDHFEHWVNGVKVLDGGLHSEEALAGNAKRWAVAPTIRSILDNAKASGPISLTHHGAAVWFKNLKIRRL
jgi:hypothetical protein